MASKLSLYNDALLALGERKLASTSENRPSRRRLDTVWDGGGVKYCLEQGLWNHAMDTVAISSTPSVDPGDFYTYAFDKPEHWRRTALVSDDPQFCNKLVDYVDEGPYFFANVETLYVKYVSSDSQRGGDLSLWPENFAQYAAHYFAWKICPATTQSGTTKTDVEKDMKRLLIVAKSTDAMNETPRFVPAGSWSRARRGGGQQRNDGGSTGNLIG